VWLMSQPVVYKQSHVWVADTGVCGDRFVWSFFVPRDGSGIYTS
jgi:hypothetical protein